MQKELITLRPAVQSDLEAVAQLLHAEGKRVHIDQVELNQFFVLTHGRKLIGVLHGKWEGLNLIRSWVVVHPLYPEGSVNLAINAMIAAVWNRQVFDAKSLNDRKILMGC